MKSCNNCGKTNYISVERCVQCNMAGNFTFQEMPAGAPSAETGVSMQCRNCGNRHPGEGPKCIHCHFPIAVKTKQITSAQPVTMKKVS